MQSLSRRLAAFKAGKYQPPFTSPDYSSRWGGAVFKVGENVGYRNTFARWHESPAIPFRFAGLAHEILSLRHTGWYTRHDDPCSDELARGVVYMLPHSRFIAAMVDPWNGRKNGTGPCIVECKPNGEPFIYDDKYEAARAADGLAERYAESGREDDRLQGEIRQQEESIEENERKMDEARNETRALLSEIRASTLSPGLCERMKGEVRSLRAIMHRAFREICQARKTLATLNA